MAGLFWGANVPVSMPEPSKHAILVDMGATGFTRYGLNHNLSSADLAALQQPTFAPEEDTRE